MNDFTMKDFILEVMVKPLPKIALESAIKGSATYLAFTGLLGVITWIICKINGRKEDAA